MSENNPAKPQYDESSIQRLSAVEHVRRYPRMYIGSVDTNAFYRLIFEFIDCIVAEHKVSAIYGDTVGCCDNIVLTLHNEQRISIGSNGPSIRVDTHGWLNKPLAELWMTDGIGQLSSVEYVMVNALSAELTIEIKHSGYLWQQAYREGKPQSDLVRVRPLDPGESTGMNFSFKPDFTIFEPFEFSYEIIARHFRELAFLLKGLTLTLRDERSQPEGKNVSFYSENVLADFVAYLNRNYTPLHLTIHAKDAILINRSNKTFELLIEIALQYVEETTSISLSFANNQNTLDGGEHVDGFIEGLQGAINRFAERNGSWDTYTAPAREDLLEGLTSVISINCDFMSFYNMSKRRMIAPEFKELVVDLTQKSIDNFASQNPDAMQCILDKCLENKRQREQRLYSE